MLQLQDTSDPGFDIFLVAGQSNASGRGAVDLTRLDPVNARVWQYGATQPGSTTTPVLGAITLAIDPLAQHDGSAAALGPATAFAREYLLTAPPNRKVLLIPSAHGSTALIDDSSLGWHWGIAGNLSDQAVQQTIAAKAMADLVPGSRNDIMGILWVQGENDGGGADVSATYRTYLDALIDGFRTAFNLPTLPFVLGQMVPDYLTVGSRAAINVAHIDTPRRKVRTAFGYGPAGAIYDTGDLSHYSGAGQRLLAQSMLAAFNRARLNVLGVAPIPPATPVLTQSGTTVNVTWPQPAGRVTDFAVRSRQGAGAFAALTRAQSIDITAQITGQTLGSVVSVQVASINEQGTSVYSNTGTLTLAQTPNAVTGFATGTAAYASMPLSWTAPVADTTHSPATAYLVEYKKNADSTWTTFATVAATSATVTGLADGTSYDFRVTPSNAGGAGTVSATATTSTLTLPAPLDAVATASAGAYGVRKLRAAYAGKALRVRRSSDSTEQDIGFVGSNLDTAALTTFAGAGSAFVTKWYDQSPAAIDFTQPTAANQPIIVNAGTLVTAPNGAPAVQGDGTASFLFRTSGFYAAGATSSFVVLKGTTANAIVLAERRSSAVQPNYNMLGQYSTGGLASIGITNDAGTAVLATGFGGAAYSATVAHQVSTVDSGSSLARWVDATVVTPVAYTRSGTTTLDILGMFASVRGVSAPSNFWGGLVTEVLLYTSALSNTDRSSLEASQKTYYGTP